MSLFFGETEITKLRDLAPQTGLDITDLWFGETNVYTVWQTYEGTLPATINANGDDMRQYRVYGATGGVGDRTENRLDYGTVENGYTLNSTTGKPTTKSDGRTATMTPIDVSGLENVTLYFTATSVAGKRAMYSVLDANDSLLERTTNISSGSTVIVLPSGAAKIYLSWYMISGDLIKDDIKNAMLTNGTTPPETFVPFGYEVDIGVSSSNVMPSAPVETKTSNGITITCDGKGRYSISGTASSNSDAYINFYFPEFTPPVAIGSGGNGAFLCFNSFTKSFSDLVFQFFKNDDKIFETSFAQKDKVLTSYNISAINRFRIYVRRGVNVVGDFALMFTNDGTSSASYQPYSNIATPIYIGDTPLDKDEYVDYQAGKIYRKKQVHTDTVTIDGIVWDILGYDHDTVYKSDNTLAQHSVTIQVHDALSDMQFDAKEALFAFDSGLAAGTYHFTVGAQPWYSGDVNKTIQFTLTQVLPAGGQLVINNAYNATMIGATISAFASSTATTATETVTMSEGNSGTDLGTVTTGLSQDGIINSIQRAFVGSNKWEESCIRQYLNSSAPAGSVWEPKNKWDRPPTWVVNTAGFLSSMSADFIANIGTTSKTTALNTVTDGGGAGTTLDKMFLLSRSEVYGGNEVSGGEGTPYLYYADYSNLSEAGIGNDSNRIKYRNGAAKSWMLRSPRDDTAQAVRNLSIYGSISNYTAASANAVVPACVIILDDIATNQWLQEKFLKTVDPPVALPALPTAEGTTIVDYAGGGTAPENVVFKYRKEGF